MTMIETIKENPWKILFGSASSIIAIIGALFALDARYAHAADVEKAKIETKFYIQETALTIRKQNLEDKLFELELKRAQSKDQKLSPMEQALHDRYTRQSQEISSRNK